MHDGHLVCAGHCGGHHGLNTDEIQATVGTEVGTDSVDNGRCSAVGFLNKQDKGCSSFTCNKCHSFHILQSHLRNSPYLMVDWNISQLRLEANGKLAPQEGELRLNVHSHSQQ